MSRVQKFEKQIDIDDAQPHSAEQQSSRPPLARRPDETLPKALSRLHYSARVS